MSIIRYIFQDNCKEISAEGVVGLAQQCEPMGDIGLISCFTGSSSCREKDSQVRQEVSG